MESYESLRLKESDKIQKTNFWDRFKKENSQESGIQEDFRESSQNIQKESSYQANFSTSETSSQELLASMEQTSLNPQEKEEVLQKETNKG